MTDDSDDYFETEIPLTPEQDSQFASLGKLLLVVVALAAVGVAIVALFAVI